MNYSVSPAAISVSQVFGKREYFPKITIACMGDILMVAATLTHKIERDNGWSPTVVMEMIQRATMQGIVWAWEMERDTAMREWSVIGTTSVLAGSQIIKLESV